MSKICLHNMNEWKFLVYLFSFFSFFGHTSTFIVSSRWTLPAIVKGRNLQKQEFSWNLWELIRRCQSRAARRRPQSPWRVKPPRRGGALCRCPECTWWRWPQKRRTRRQRTCQWPTALWSDWGRQWGSLGCWVSSSPVLQGSGSPTAPPGKHVGSSRALFSIWSSNHLW